MPTKLLLIICLLFAFQATTHSQQVHLKTGNFSVKHTDVAFNVGYEAKLARVYNSTANYKSVFGWNWTFDFTKALVVNPDGSIVTKECECEGRTNNVFKPSSFDETARSAAIETIAAAVQSKQAMNTEDLYTYKQKLAGDRGFLMDEWKKLIDLKLIKPYVVPTGTKLISKNFSYELITKTAVGYELTNGSIKKYYNNDGLLTKEVNGRNSLTLSYNPQQELIEIKDQLNNKYAFTYRNGLVVEVVASGTVNDVIKYSYKNDELVAVTKKKGKLFNYTYRNDGAHQLTTIKNEDGPAQVIAYANDAERKALFLVNRETTDSIAYAYNREQVNSNTYMKEGMATTFKSEYDEDEDEEEDEDKIAKKKAEAKYRESKSEKNVFYISAMEDGFHYNYLTRVIKNGVEEDTYNNEEGYPDKIVKNGDTTFFQYNPFGEVIYKENKKKVEKVKYDPACGKMVAYSHFDKYDNKLSWTKFSYNEKCDLVRAENSDSLKLELRYDENGQIIWIKDFFENKELSFKYNHLNKPIQILAHNLGVLNVTYTPEGEVATVKAADTSGAEGGHKIALGVTQLFQNLLTVVKVDRLKPCKCSN